VIDFTYDAKERSSTLDFVWQRAPATKKRLAPDSHSMALLESEEWKQTRCATLKKSTRNTNVSSSLRTTTVSCVAMFLNYDMYATTKVT
jgi:hypothetical protein